MNYKDLFMNFLLTVNLYLGGLGTLHFHFLIRTSAILASLQSSLSSFYINPLFDKQPNPLNLIVEIVAQPEEAGHALDGLHYFRQY
jgi:hypothetical protein